MEKNKSGKEGIGKAGIWGGVSAKSSLRRRYFSKELVLSHPSAIRGKTFQAEATTSAKVLRLTVRSVPAVLKKPV